METLVSQTTLQFLHWPLLHLILTWHWCRLLNNGGDWLGQTNVVQDAGGCGEAVHGGDRVGQVDTAKIIGDIDSERRLFESDHHQSSGPGEVDLGVERVLQVDSDGGVAVATGAGVLLYLTHLVHKTKVMNQTMETTLLLQQLVHGVLLVL